MTLGGYSTAMPEYFDTDSGPSEFWLTFDYPRPPISGNSRMHWAEKMRRTRDIRLASKLLAARIPDLGRITVDLTWFVKDHTRRDGGENLAPTLKPMIDGLVDAGVVLDDDPAHVVRGPSIVTYEQGCTPRMVLHIAQLEPGAVAAWATAC